MCKKFKSGGLLRGARDAAFIIVQVFFSFWIIELCCAIYLQAHPERGAYRYHPVLFWEHRENLREYTGQFRADLEGPINTNPDGFRDCTAIPGWHAGIFRVMVVGDSTLYGFGVRRYETLESVLEELLRKEAIRRGLPGESVEVINAGVSGYSSYQGVYHWRLKCKKYRPDVLVVAYHYGDRMADISTDAARNTAPEWLKNFECLLNRSALVQILQRREHGKDELLSARGAGMVARVPVMVYAANLAYFAREVRAQGGQVVFLELPAPEPGPGEYREVMAMTAATLNAPLVDCFGEFHALPWEKQVALSIDGLHPNAEGHKLIGEALFRAIRPLAFAPSTLTDSAPRIK